MALSIRTFDTVSKRNFIVPSPLQPISAFTLFGPALNYWQLRSSSHGLSHNTVKEMRTYMLVKGILFQFFNTFPHQLIQRSKESSRTFHNLIVVQNKKGWFMIHRVWDVLKVLFRKQPNNEVPFSDHWAPTTLEEDAGGPLWVSLLDNEVSES